ncbi:TetR/AcrR family transcriptional regulator [Micromonospora sp. NBC_01813]|uniref:TetR/AcrR family transcriptional regulator n=1 Tax=Micromonospora sp. NBC_01813 TaxID=2975988 RepID=UPI002DD83154|nr:helix-turn-helix domain-containing protein [Micromonospora sp. NBC_01813]WSA12822.1 TetR/AcrR family transcriptional regulator [Micromonospora sp. NBC_01813]
MARELFAAADDANTPISMNEVARRAGVGVATLYRHFGTREELAEAVYLSKVEEVTERAAQRTRHGDARTALAAWSEDFASFMLAKRGMMDTLRSSWMSEDITASPIAQRIADIVAGFLRRADVDRSLRPGLDAFDVSLAVLALLTTASTDDSGPRVHRLIALFIDGLAPPTQGTERDEAGS